MKYIDLTTQQDAIKQFFLALSTDPEGSVVELNGKAVARVTPIQPNPAKIHQANAGWNDAKNARRCELVDRDIDGTLLPNEVDELRVLQSQMLEERRRLAPVPLDELRHLHQELLAKALQGGKAG
jgi:hypothetical protein